MSEQVLCKDCKHSFRKFSELPQWGSGSEWRCRLNYIEDEIIENRVTGNIKVAPYYARCSASRMNWRLQEGVKLCGKEGKWWAPRNNKDLFKFIKHVSV
jgi:hypothetical protein